MYLESAANHLLPGAMYRPHDADRALHLELFPILVAYTKADERYMACI